MPSSEPPLRLVTSGDTAANIPDAGLKDAGLKDAVRAMDVDALRDLVLTLAQRDSAVRRMVEARASSPAGTDVEITATLDERVRKALSIRGAVDRRRSRDVARRASDLLDELEGHLARGAADAVRPALLRAVTRLRKILEQVDDSSGLIGAQCQRAADLYAKACRQGSPDPAKLATWLAKFRADSPGWPTLYLSDFVDAFDDKALATYRRAVVALDGKRTENDRCSRFEIDAMLLELADHDGDLDRAVELLSRGEHPQYGAIVDRLRGAGRAVDAVAWIDRAVLAGRISSHGGGNEFWLDPDDVAHTYQTRGRIDDAVEVLRDQFVRRPSAQNYCALLAFADELGRADTERSWALDHARKLATDRTRAGAVLVQLLLGDGEIDAAWEAADQYGAGYAWRELAVRGAAARPIAAANLYRPQLEQDLRHPNSAGYPDVAEALATMRTLYEQGGRGADFATYLAKIRTDYARRPALLKELDAKGL